MAGFPITKGKSLHSQMVITLKPVAWVKNSRHQTVDDFWGDVVSEILLDDEIPEAVFNQITGFSHLEIIYYFDQVKADHFVYSRRPRGNPEFPEMGIFAQRNKDRPNQLGLCTVELIWHRGRSIGVKYLDAIDGTPVLDIKPVFQEFRPRGETRQPDWVSELMKVYWDSEKK
jgi:tRNA (adenine37-N6)-methyltransferase